MRTGAIAVALLPPWAAYLVALIEWPDTGWIDVATLRLGMGVEWVAAAVFPLLVGLWLDTRPPRIVRLVIALAAGTAITAFVHQAFGAPGASLFWINGGITYIGWLWAKTDERRLETMLARWLLTFGCLIPLLLAVIVVSRLTGADDVLLLGFLYFLALYALELTGTFTRFQRWFVGLQGRRPAHSPRPKA